MIALGLALALAAGASPAPTARLSPAPVSLFRVAWQRPTVPPPPLEVGPYEPGGPAVDPVTRLVVYGTRDGWLHAVRPDGTLAWEFRTDGAFLAPPAIAGDTVYAGSADGRVYALGVPDGRERWRYDAREEIGARPAVAGGTVFVATMQDTLLALDAQTGAWKWHQRREPRDGVTIRGVAAPLVRGAVVYGAFADGFVSALDVESGQVRWQRQVAPAGDYLDVDALRLLGSRLYAAAYSGAVLALDAGTGEPVWTFKAPGASRLAIGGGLLVAVTPTHVYGLTLDAGTVAWSAPLEGSPSGDPVFVGQWLAVPAGRGGLRFLEPGSGRVLRVFDPGTGVSAAPAVLGRRVYVLSNGGDLFALDLT